MKRAEEILIEARNRAGLTQTQVAEKIGVGLRMYQKIEAGEFPKYKKDTVIAIDKTLNTSLYEMIYEQKSELGATKSLEMKKNEGFKLREDILELGLSFERIAELLRMSVENFKKEWNKDVLSDDFVSLILENLNNIKKAKQLGIPIFDHVATAGGLENVSQLPEIPSYYDTIHGYEDCNFGMRVYGHSMYPTIESGCLILCKKINDKSIILFGEIYLLRTADYLMVKRLQKSGLKGNVFCKSDNEVNDSRFEPFDLGIDKIIDLYIVKGIIKKVN